MFNFSQEEEQKEYGPQGPVPAGSIVFLEMEVLQPDYSRQAPDNPLISVSTKGLRQLYCQFTVTRGEYAGVGFRQNITLPQGAQNIELSPNYEMACKIGGSLLKAILLVSGNKAMRVNSLQEFNGATFPAKLKISKKPYVTRNGQEYWRNEISSVITPNMPLYREVMQRGEIINSDGAVAGKRQASSYNTYEAREAVRQSGYCEPMANGALAKQPSYESETDDVPF